MKFDVVYEPTGTGWSAYAPDVTGVGVAASTREEAIGLMRAALALHLDIPRDNVELQEHCVTVQSTPNGFVAFLVPHVAGCWHEAPTEDGAKEKLADAIEYGCLRAQSANIMLYPHVAESVPRLSQRSSLV